MSTIVLTRPNARIGQFNIKLRTHWTTPDTFVLSANHALHQSPIAQNVVDAAQLIGVDVTGLPVEVGGMFARIEITSAQLAASTSALAQALREAALARAAAWAAQIAAVTEAEA